MTNHIEKAKTALEYAHSFPVRDAKDMALVAIANALVAIADGRGTCRDEGGIGTKFPAVFICSECGWRSTVFAFGEGMPCYCPNCGAKVVSE